MTGVEPLDSTKAGKGKSSTEWKTEETNAKSDAPLANGQQVGAGSAFGLQGNGSNSSGLRPLLKHTAQINLRQTQDNAQTGKFSKYLNTAQALHQMGVIVPSLETWPGKPSTGIATRAAGGVSVQAATRLDFYKWRSAECNNKVIPHLHAPTRLLKWPDRCDGFKRGTEFVVLGCRGGPGIGSRNLMSPHRAQLGHRQAEAVCRKPVGF
ncbi:hypothetical protein MPTA7396_0980 [Mycoplasmoides pneumoniae]|nr:hypothetical protein [Mycoplasmoides pneumoniae]